MTKTVEQLGNGLTIVQDSTLYRFTTDAVLLANMVSGVRGKAVADLGCGSGIISLLLAGKKNVASVLAIELQQQVAEMAQQSVINNNLQDIITIVCGDMVKLASNYRNKLDCVVCNPPYRRVGSGEQQLSQTLAISRHEIAVTLKQVIETASIMLNNRGSFFMVHQSSRLAEIMYTCSNYNIEPKEIWPICPNQSSDANLVIIKGVKMGKPDCILHKPIVIYDENGNYTSTVASMYKGD